jgi:hypothetical protein
MVLRNQISIREGELSHRSLRRNIHLPIAGQYRAETPFGGLVARDPEIGKKVVFPTGHNGGA